ncbi:MAG: hypothetical protein ABSD49_03375 [Candidatus Bathyarchaeia archaeon]|jgi:hypothetical protein
MSENMVEIKMQVPKSLSDFVEKVAALEGSTPEAWYLHWIGQAFGAIARNDFTELVDADKMKQVYCQ